VHLFTERRRVDELGERGRDDVADPMRATTSPRISCRACRSPWRRVKDRGRKRAWRRSAGARSRCAARPPIQADAPREIARRVGIHAGEPISEGRRHLRYGGQRRQPAVLHGGARRRLRVGLSGRSGQPRRFTFEKHGPLHSKGIREPMAAFAVAIRSHRHHPPPRPEVAAPGRAPPRRCGPSGVRLPVVVGS